MCINGLSIHMSLHLELAWYPWRLEAILGCPRTDLKKSEATIWELDFGCMEEQQCTELLNHLSSPNSNFL